MERMLPKARELTHQQKVTGLYRDALRCMMSWAIERNIINKEAVRIRERFEQYRNLDPASPEVKRIIKEAEQELFEYTHPDKYTLPYMPGGTKFMRNPPPPLFTIFPEGVPADVEAATDTVHIDMVPTSIRPEIPEGTVVDFASKQSITRIMSPDE